MVARSITPVCREDAANVGTDGTATETGPVTSELLRGADGPLGDDSPAAPRAIAPVGAGRVARLLTERSPGLGGLAAAEADEPPLPPGPGASVGDAHATPVPPTATPIPNATARPPTRPTYADACISISPRIWTSSRQSLVDIKGGADVPSKNIQRTARPRYRVLPSSPHPYAIMSHIRCSARAETLSWKDFSPFDLNALRTIHRHCVVDMTSSRADRNSVVRGGD